MLQPKRDNEGLEKIFVMFLFHIGSPLFESLVDSKYVKVRFSRKLIFATISSSLHKGIKSYLGSSATTILETCSIISPSMIYTVVAQLLFATAHESKEKIQAI
jgi:hypothetical protein